MNIGTVHSVKGTGKGLTWIPVVCNTVDYPGRCFPSTSWSANSTSSGYAIYETVEWEAAINTGVYKDWDKTISGFNSTNSNGTYKYPSLHEEATAPDPLLFLPAAGYRNFNNATMRYTDPYGLYWSSNVCGKLASYLYFDVSRVGPYFCDARALGLSIRCVAE
jgi:hypothetical protein